MASRDCFVVGFQQKLQILNKVDDTYTLSIMMLATWATTLAQEPAAPSPAQEPAAPPSPPHGPRLAYVGLLVIPAGVLGCFYLLALRWLWQGAGSSTHEAPGEPAAVGREAQSRARWLVRRLSALRQSVLGYHGSAGRDDGLASLRDEM